MWVPELMSRFLLATTKDDITEVLEFFGKEGKFHIVDFKDKKLEEPRYGETYQNLKEYKKDIEGIIEYFEIKVKKELPIHAVDATIVEKEVGEFLSEFQSELGKKQDRLKNLKEKEQRLNIVSELLALLPESETPIEELRSGKSFKMVGGTIPEIERENLYEIIEGEYIFVFVRPIQDKRIPITLFYQKQDDEKLDKVKKQVRFSEIEEFNKLEGPIVKLKESIEMGFWEIKEERAQIQILIQEMGEDIEERILELERNVEISLRELEWVNKMARTENLFFIEAYIPYRFVHEIKEKGEKLNLYVLMEDEVKRNSIEAENTPIKLCNFSIFKPFEFLVKTYGAPSYSGIDPTIPTTLTFLFIYGIMFSDIGHGLILTLIGLGLYFLKYLRKYTIFPVTMGISSIIFGVLFGEFFGTHPFNPIWFSPFENPERAIIFAIYLGIGIVTFGFILKLIENLLKREYEGFLLSGEGIPGFIFYISIILLAFSVINNSNNAIIITVGIIAAISIIVVALGKPIKEAMKGSLNTDHLLLSLGEVIHLSLALISNTLSFIRVAAFNISHIILTISIITIAEMFGEMVLAGKYSTLVFGNLFIIILEGMIVFIQALRLEYYEFYSRFFERGKSLYEPMKIS
jgi:V/A-type H+-transporting ATPase subunit I